MMKTLIEELIFDKKVVDSLKKAEVDNALLYNYLISGKITLKEFLSLSEAE